MDLATVYYLGMTILLFAVFAIIVAKTLNRKRKKKGEEPKYRMMDDD